MERIRSAGVEPFDFEAADMSDDLWLGEGFTNYFDGLIQHRAGFTTLEGFAGELAGVINAVTLSPGRMFRSAVDMSRLAPFVDAAASIDRTAWPNLFISYYTYGQAIGLGLDLSLRDRTEWQGHRRRLHARAVGAVRQTGSEGAGQGQHGVFDRRIERGAGQDRRRSQPSRMISSRSTSKAASWSTTRACWRAPAW